MGSSSDPGRRTYRLYLSLRFCLALPAWVVIAVYLVREADLNPLQLVLMGTVTGTAVIVCEIPTGAVADRVSRRLSLGIAWLLQGGAWALAGATKSFDVILAAWVVWGIGSAFESAAFQAWVTDEVGPHRRGRRHGHDGWGRAALHARDRLHTRAVRRAQPAAGTARYRPHRHQARAPSSDAACCS